MHMQHILALKYNWCFILAFKFNSIAFYSLICQLIENLFLNLMKQSNGHPLVNV